MNSEAKTSLVKLGWMVGLVATAMVIISGVEKRSQAGAESLEISVHPLEDGKFLITDKEVKKIIGTGFGSDLVGEQLKNIDVERLELLLEEEPFVLNADAYLDAQNRLHVEIDQRKALVRIMDSNGLDYYLDENGVKMPPSKHYAARVIIATGNIPPYTSDYLERKNHLLKDLFQLVNFIENDELLNLLIDQIHVSKGDFILVPKIGKHKIVLGSLEMLDDKIERLKIFYKEGIGREGWRKYDRIDLRFEGQVVAGK